MIAQHPKNISACVFFARCETPQLFGTMGKVTAARLRDAAHLAANKVVSEMAARLDAPLPADALQCAYVGTQEEDAPLTSRTPIVFEWRLRGGGVAKTNTIAMRVLHKGYKNGLALPVSFRNVGLFLRILLFNCLSHLPFQCFCRASAPESLVPAVYKMIKETKHNKGPHIDLADHLLVIEVSDAQMQAEQVL